MKGNREDRKFGAGHVGKGNLIDEWDELGEEVGLAPHQRQQLVFMGLVPT